MSNGIATRQNEDNSIAMLAAQRQLYREAKKYNTVSVALSVWIPLALAVILLFLPENTEWRYASYILSIVSMFFSFVIDTPVYNFINDRLVDESAVLRPLSWHLILYVFRYFSRKWQKISDCECPDLIQNETPVRFLYGTQKNVRSDRAESSWHSN